MPDTSRVSCPKPAARMRSPLSCGAMHVPNAAAPIPIKLGATYLAPVFAWCERNISAT